MQLQFWPSQMLAIILAMAMFQDQFPGSHILGRIYLYQISKGFNLRGFSGASMWFNGKRWRCGRTSQYFQRYWRLMFRDQTSKFYVESVQPTRSPCLLRFRSRRVEVVTGALWFDLWIKTPPCPYLVCPEWTNPSSNITQVWRKLRLFLFSTLQLLSFLAAPRSC